MSATFEIEFGNFYYELLQSENSDMKISLKYLSAHPKTSTSEFLFIYYLKKILD